jgi:hypothetical protein
MFLMTNSPTNLFITNIKSRLSEVKDGFLCQNTEGYKIRKTDSQQEKFDADYPLIIAHYL